MTLRLLTGLTALAFVFTACAPESKATPAASEAKTAETEAVSAYRTWVLGQTDLFLQQTEAFAQAVLAGDRSKAESLYAPARMYYERIEPIAEALGDLDPRLDAREGDVADADWRGYHRLEKALWKNEDLASVKDFAEGLVNDARLLRAQVETAEITVSSMVTGAVELLNEVSTSKVTGEEERYSRTDLYDFRANVEGAEQIWKILAPSVRTSDAQLAQTIDDRFSVLYGLLEAQHTNGVYRAYDDVSAAEVKALSESVDALAEPLAQLATHFSAN